MKYSVTKSYYDPLQEMKKLNIIYYLKFWRSIQSREGQLDWWLKFEKFYSVYILHLH